VNRQVRDDTGGSTRLGKGCGILTRFNSLVNLGELACEGAQAV